MANCHKVIMKVAPWDTSFTGQSSNAGDKKLASSHHQDASF